MTENLQQKLEKIFEEGGKDKPKNFSIMDESVGVCGIVSTKCLSNPNILFLGCISILF